MGHRILLTIIAALGLVAAAAVRSRSAPRPPAPPAPTAEAHLPEPPALLTPRPPRPQLDGRGFPDKVLALTWDDGPDDGTFELAQYLHRENVSATFFVVGAWSSDVSADPGEGAGVFETGYEPIPVLGDLVEMGHRVANHTLNHVLLNDADAATVTYQLGENQARIDPWITNEWRLFRAPGGAWNAEASGAVDADPRTRGLVGPIRWDVDGKDWEKSLYCRSSRPTDECEPAAPGHAARVRPAAVAKRYLAAIESAGRGVVLFHDRVGHVGSRYAIDVARRVIPELKKRGYVFAAPVLRFSALAPRGVVDPEARGPLHIADVDGDGKEDVCARTPSGVGCATAEVSTSVSGAPETALRPAAPWDHALADDGGGWSAPEHGSTAQLADVNGDGRADLCARGADGIACALAGPARGFGMLQGFSASHRLASGELADFSDDEGWASDESYYGTIRFGDVDGDGKADVCGRGPDGVVCARSLGNGLDRARLWLHELTDAEGWLSSERASTIALADVTGDGKADLCARARDGIVCAESRGAGFSRARRWSRGGDFADADAVSDAGFYRSVRFGDVNGDGRADLCARAREGIVCALSTGRGFTRATTWVRADELTAAGLDAGASLELGDVNGDGRADLCGRGLDGVVCGLAP